MNTSLEQPVFPEQLTAVSKIEGSADSWTEVISPRSSLLDLRLKELWRYRDLVIMFVRRDFVSNYKQTILGPIWFFLQPLLTTITFVIIFGKIAKTSPDGVPMMLFYMSGITIWNYFSECLTKTATVFKDNAAIFGKVYFPRLTMPASIVLSSLIKFGIQFALFLGFWIYFMTGKNSVHPNIYLLLVPFLIMLMGLLGLGCGMIISAMTTKYKDLVFLLTFGVQLLMYATPVIYSISSPGIEKYKSIILANPLSSIVETFRYAFMGSGSFSWFYLGYTTLFTVIILIIGTIVFNKVEKSFTDTV
jgi:lipopolysaccharide transport system permease protein